jgi:hypothetical protein
MTPTESILHQIQLTHAGEPWYGSSRTVILEGVTAEQAAAHPIPGGHSIWQLVLHMISWTNEVCRRLEGATPGSPVEGDWPKVGAVSESAWKASQSALQQAHARLLTTARSVPASRWGEPVGDTQSPPLGTGVDVTGMLVGLAQHDAYHIGQIAVTKHAIAGR